MRQDKPWYDRRKSSSIETCTTLRSRVAGLLHLTVSQVPGHIAGFILALVRLWRSLFAPSAAKTPDLAAGFTIHREFEQVLSLIIETIRLILTTLDN